MQATDTIVQNYFSLMRTATATQFFYLLTILFDASFHFFFIALCVSVLIYLVRGAKYCFMFISALFVGASLVLLMKIFFSVARPDGAVINVIGGSFPSYHATIATIFFIMLMYSFDDYFRKVPKFVFNFLCILGIFLVALSRVYLGVHWVSDVFFGIVIGSVICYLTIRTSSRV